MGEDLQLLIASLVAHMVVGAIGMATASLDRRAAPPGRRPATASAACTRAEVFTTGASGLPTGGFGNMLPRSRFSDWSCPA